jgi:ABC-type Zn uptake system ZnuABC Zn-binding protein ZnuA
MKFSFRLFAFIILCLLFSVVLDAKPKVLATASMWYDMALVIGGEFVDVDVIVPIGSDPHLYEPTPSDVTKVNTAQLILINGLTFEGWLQKLIQSSGTKAIQKLLTEGIEVITSPLFKNSTDPHAWMDVENGKIYARRIYEGLAQLDPAHQKEFEFNLNVYLQQLDELHRYIQQKILLIPVTQRILITSHDAFHYYGKKYGIQVESLLGTSTEADVQTGDFIRINKMIKDFKIPAIFAESTINPKMMEQLSQENKIKIGGKLFADSLGDENTPANTYIKMMKHNTDVISAALSEIKAEDNSSTPKTKSNFIFYIAGFMFLLLLTVVVVKKFKS